MSTPKPKVRYAYALITGFAGLPNGGDVKLERGQVWDLHDAYQLSVVSQIPHLFSAKKPED